MSVLDELKKEAHAVEAQRTQQDTVRSAMQRQVLDKLLPQMQRIHGYFTEFQQHLSIVDPEINVSYELRSFGPMANLRQGGYKVTVDRPEELERFQFRFSCSRSGTVEVPIRDAISSGEYKEYLKSNGLTAKRRDAGRGASVFIVDTNVPALLDLRLDLEREAVILTLRNVNQLGSTRYTLSPDKLNEQLLDELAKMVLRKPHEFDEMMGNKLTQTGIHRIREKLHAQESAGMPVAGEVAVSPALEGPATSPGLGRRLLRAIKRT